ncbi:hypothetical protein [Bacillus bombysepticus]|uniref:hypothetical protein n=1 Tax=Bacillus bombysepticus TaxID=658666 RepID=UPI0030172714
MKKFVLGMSFAALLTGLVSTSVGHNLVHAEDKRLWNPIPKYTQKGEIQKVKNLYYDKGDIADKEIAKKQVIFIDKQMQLYDKANGNSIPMFISPQLLEVTNIASIVEDPSSGYFIEIKTWLGPKWIKWTFPNKTGYKELPISEVIYPVNGNHKGIFRDAMNGTNIPLYRSPGGNAVIEGYIGPQSLEVTSVALGDYNNFYNYSLVSLIDPKSAQNGYIGVNSWLGERWVKASDLDSQLIARDIFPVSKSNKFKLYDEPRRGIDYEAPKPEISAQSIYAFHRQGEFIKVKTWLGWKWIEADEYITKEDPNDVYIPGSFPIIIPKGAKHYDIPYFNHPAYDFDDPNNPVQIEKPQIIEEAKMTFSTGVAVINDAYYGDKTVWFYDEKGKWVSAAEVESVITAKGTIDNIGNLKLHNEDFTNAYAEVVPQKLKFKNKIGNWYLIETWLGNKWVEVTKNDSINYKEKDYTISEKTKVYKAPTSSDAQLLTEIDPQTVKELARTSLGNIEWVLVKVQSTGHTGWIIGEFNPFEGDREEG